MSEKRYELIENFIAYGSGKPEFKGYSLMADGKSHDIIEACDLLNAQAETIEVLRDWIRHTAINDDFESIDDFERKLIRIQGEGGCGGMEERVELAKRRIAALEGK